MKLICFSPKLWEANSYLLVHNGEAFLIDAGTPADKIEQALIAENATLMGILLTHGHFDHILSIDLLREKYNIPVYVHQNDAELLTNGSLNAYAMFFGTEKTWKPADRLLQDGDTINLGDKTISVLSTKGHTKGSVCYLVDDLLFSGDTLFANGYGRTDLYGGDFCELTVSINKLFSLSGKQTVYAGHGESNTLDNIKNGFTF